MAQLDALVSSMKGRSNRGNCRIGAVVNIVFNTVDAVYCTSVHNHAYFLHKKSNKSAESFA